MSNYDPLGITRHKKMKHDWQIRCRRNTEESSTFFYACRICEESRKLTIPNLNLDSLSQVLESEGAFLTPCEIPYTIELWDGKVWNSVPRRTKTEAYYDK